MRELFMSKLFWQLYVVYYVFVIGTFLRGFVSLYSAYSYHISLNAELLQTSQVPAVAGEARIIVIQ